MAGNGKPWPGEAGRALWRRRRKPPGGRKRGLRGAATIPGEDGRKKLRESALRNRKIMRKEKKGRERTATSSCCAQRARQGAGAKKDGGAGEGEKMKMRTEAGQVKSQSIHSSYKFIILDFLKKSRSKMAKISM